jgi:hypothetical protein
MPIHGVGTHRGIRRNACRRNDIGEKGSDAVVGDGKAREARANSVKRFKKIGCGSRI